MPQTQAYQGFAGSKRCDDRLDDNTDGGLFASTLEISVSENGR